MNWASWWNGVLTVLALLDFGTLINCIWNHDENRIFALALLGVFVLTFWMLSLMGTKE